MQTNKLLALKMTENHSFPITPPPELVQQWRKSGPADAAVNNAYECHIATQAAQWGADQELEACCEWMTRMGYWGDDGKAIPALRAARRPKPPSLKEQALEIVKGTPVNSAGLYSYEHVEIIRRALEQLDD
jgi:hypothetical protein